MPAITKTGIRRAGPFLSVFFIMGEMLPGREMISLHCQ